MLFSDYIFFVSLGWHVALRFTEVFFTHFGVFQQMVKRDFWDDQKRTLEVFKFLIFLISAPKILFINYTMKEDTR